MFQETLDRDGESLKGVLHLWSLDAAPADQLTIPNLEYAQILGCASVLHLVQALAKREAHSASLWLVTQDAVPAAAKGQVTGLAQSPLWGLGKGIALEHPEFWGGMIDVASSDMQGMAEAIFTEISEPDAEDFLAHPEGGRHVARLVSSHPAPSSEDRPLRPDASYLITGGLGGLGMQVARWMAEQGGRHLLLMGRHHPSDQAAETIRQLRETGVEVRVVQGDVAVESELSAVLEPIGKQMPPLRGVIHAAGVSQNEAIEAITLDSLQAMLRPKVQGAWLLHRLTQEMPLDIFLCFSSGASVWGAKAQAHYAAANHFLDMLAHYRQGLGLPALTINWGHWGGGGMVSAKAEIWLNRQGIETMPPQSAIEAMAHLLSAKRPQVTVAHVNWPVFKAICEVRGERPLLAQMKGKPSGMTERPSIERRPDFKKDIMSLADEERQARLTLWVQSHVSKVLGLDPSRPISPQQGFFDLGMDSLTSVELRNLLQADLDIELPSTLAFDYPTLESLVHYLALEIKALTPATEDASDDASADAPFSDATEEGDDDLEELLTEIDTLSEDEVRLRISDR